MFTKIYCLPIWVFLLFGVILILLYLLFRIKTVSYILLAFGIPIILFTTLFRSPNDSFSLILTPFITFHWAKENPEYYRTYLLNGLLFLPFGLGLAGSLSDSMELKMRMIIVILSGLMLSIAVEAAQFIFSLGDTEVDDVIANTLGTVIAAFALRIREKIWKIRK